jgi:hypothetical protein
VRGPIGGFIDQPGAPVLGGRESRRLLDSSKRRPPLATKGSGLIEGRETASMPLKQPSPRCLLIARDAQSSKHSQRYGLVEGGLAYATNATAPPESLLRSL